MLSARAYSFRQKSRLAISLSWVGGYTNIVVFLATGAFICRQEDGRSLDPASAGLTLPGYSQQRCPFLGRKLHHVLLQGNLFATPHGKDSLP